MPRLSRVFDPDAVEVKPITWRVSTPAARVKHLPSAGRGDEAALLRVRIQELTEDSEKQARQANEAGHRAGLIAGREAAQDDVNQTVEKLSETIGEVAGARAEALRRAETDVVKLSIEIARRVLHRELSLDSSALEGLIRAALDKLQAQEVYRVRVHPEHQLVLRACLEQSGRGGNVEVLSDPSQARGGAVFEMSRGSLDASVETQLQEIERGLVDQLEQRL
jgi:flagellar assembly protein FliH